MNQETRQMLNRIQAALRNTAEQDHNDILANAASDLSVRLESVGTTFGMKLADLTDLDRQLIQYSLNTHKQGETA